MSSLHVQTFEKVRHNKKTFSITDKKNLVHRRCYIIKKQFCDVTDKREGWLRRLYFHPTFLMHFIKHPSLFNLKTQYVREAKNCQSNIHPALIAVSYIEKVSKMTNINSVTFYEKIKSLITIILQAIINSILLSPNSITVVLNRGALKKFLGCRKYVL